MVMMMMMMMMMRRMVAVAIGDMYFEHMMRYYV